MEKRYRNFEIILYTDSNDYLDYLEFLEKNFNIIGIKHDRDIYEEDSESHVKGEIKKVHYHLLFNFENALTKSAFVKKIDYIDNLVTPITNIKKFLLYMIHFNDSTKFNYSISDCFGSEKLIDTLATLVKKESKTESLDMKAILDYINDCDWIISLNDFSYWVLSNDFWSSYRRNFSLIKSLLLSHNARIESEKYK